MKEDISLFNFADLMNFPFKVGKETKDLIRSHFMELEEEGNDWTRFTKIDDTYPFAYVTSFEQRGDGQGYETFYIFKRKCDGKHFYYYIYDGRIENWELTECKAEAKVVWDFECQY